MEDPADNLFIRFSLQYIGVFSTLAVVAMVVSGFLVINVISTIVLEQKRQIGVMKSLGATRLDNFMMYGGIAFVYGLIGMVPGVLLGVPLGYQLARLFASMGPNALIEEFSISPLGVALGVGMGLLVPVLFALIPVYVGTRVTILEAMTDLGISTTYGGSRIARLVGALPLPINARQALSSVIRKKWRVAFTVATLMFAVAAFMGVFAVVYNLNRVLSGVFDAYGFDIQAIPTDIQSFDEVKGLILDGVEGVGAVYPSSSLAVQVEGYTDQFLGGDQLQVIGLDPTTDSFRLDLKEGTAWQGDPTREGIVLSTGVAEQLGKHAGDTLVVAAGGKAVELDIIGIDRFPFDQAFMEWQALARLGGLSVDAPRPNQYMALVQVDGYSGTLPGGEAVAVGFDEQIVGFLTFESGAAFTAAQPSVIVSTDMAANGGYQVGDDLTLSVGGNTETYPIVGVFNLPPQAVSEGDPADVIGIYWEALAALEGRDLEGEPAPNAFLIQLEDPDATSDQADEVVKAISEVLVERGITANYINQIALVEENAEQMLMFGMLFNMTSFVMAAVGAIGLLSTLSMSVFERQKEIGVMRSIGAGSGTVAGQFLVEGLLVGFIAWLIGVPVSYVLGMGLLQAMPFGFIKFSYPLINPIIGLIGILIIAAAASLWPSISAARRTVSQIIRYQ
jgi:ABC-type antimicrobial peptide transport system permease subunit